MAIELKLFERVESGKGLFAVESISLIYNALTTILILLLYPRMDHPGMMLLERLGIVVRTDIFVSGIPLPLDGFCPYGRANVTVGILVSGYV